MPSGIAGVASFEIAGGGSVGDGAWGVVGVVACGALTPAGGIIGKVTRGPFGVCAFAGTLPSIARIITPGTIAFAFMPSPDPRSAHHWTMTPGRKDCARRIPYSSARDREEFNEDNGFDGSRIH